jgi:hypothetical protein
MRDRRPGAALMIFAGAVTAIRFALNTKRYHDSLGDQQPGYLGLLTMIAITAYLSLRIIPLMQQYIGIFAEDNAAAAGNQRNQDAVARAHIPQDQMR